MLRRVLIAGSSSNFNETFGDAGLPYSIDRANSEQDAWNQLRNNRYDLVCIDASLASDGGFTFARDLRAHDDTPPLVLTGSSNKPGNLENLNQLGDAISLRLEDVPGHLARLFGPLGIKQMTSVETSQAANMAVPLVPGPDTPDAAPRILAYSHDSIGLGHMRRNSNILSRVIAQTPGASALMVVGSPAGFVFDLPSGMDFVKLPSLAKFPDGTFQAANLNVTNERIRRLRTSMFRQTVEEFEPDVVLVDHVPLGVWGELEDTLAWLQHLPNKPHVILGLRDILDVPEKVRRDWQENGADRAIQSYYDEVLIYGERDVFDTAKAYGLEDLAPGRVKFCGYVTNDVSTQDGSEIRRRLGAENRPFILLSGGGGRDAFPVLKGSLDAIGSMLADQRPVVKVVTGPLMPAEQRARLRRQSERLDCHFAERVPNFPDLLAAADRLVGMGGYNSVNEALSLGVPTLIIPREGPSQEQKTRAELLAAQGLVDMISLSDATPEKLAAVFAKTQKKQRELKSRWKVRGASTAAAHIAKIAQDRATFRNVLCSAHPQSLRLAQ